MGILAYPWRRYALYRFLLVFLIVLISKLMVNIGYLPFNPNAPFTLHTVRPAVRSFWHNIPVLQLASEVRMQPFDTVAKRPFTCTVLCHYVPPKDEQVTTIFTTLTTPSVPIARNLSAYDCFHVRLPTVPKSVAKILNISKFR